jgi:hypothetical protein
MESLSFLKGVANVTYIFLKVFFFFLNSPVMLAHEIILFRTSFFFKFVLIVLRFHFFQKIVEKIICERNNYLLLKCLCFTLIKNELR